MSEIDRVFARLGGRQPAEGDQRELRRIPRRGAATGSRVVEVVRLPARGASATGSPRRSDAAVRAQTWDEGFPAKSVPPPSPAPQPVPAEAPEPVTHVMPVWQRTIVEPEMEAAPTAPPEPAQSAARPPSKRALRTATAASRRVADPFDPDDEGANCVRCGYLIEPARERRGIMTCAECG